MKLWILRPFASRLDDPWDPCYDKAFGFVVRAETEAEARELADTQAGDENDDGQPWKDAKYSACDELLAEGDAEIVMRDFRAA